MATGLSEPIAADLTTMSVKEVCDHHRDLLVQIRCVDHWRRLIGARLDLAVAAVADLDELHPEHPGLKACSPPDGLRLLLGIAGTHSEQRLHETSLLPRLRQAIDDLDTYKLSLRSQADDAGHVLATRFDSSLEASDLL